MTGWIQTRDGRAIDLFGDEPIVMPIEEVAHSLARINRCTGHTRGDVPYSVAQHSVLCSYHVPEGFELDALGHDGHESVIGDVSSPVKEQLRAISKLFGTESAWDILEASVARRWRIGMGLNQVLPEAACVADLRALLTERRDLLGDVQARPWSIKGMAWIQTIEPWPVAKSEREFLTRWHELKAA